MIDYLKRFVRSLLIRNPRKANYKFLLKNLEPLFELKYAATVLETKRFFQVMQPIVMDRPHGTRFIIIAPHCDDDTFGAGGTLLKLAAVSAEITIIYVAEAGRNKEQIADIEMEALVQANELQARIEFLRAPIGAIPISGPVLDRLSDLLKEGRPDAVFSTFLLDDHDDHRRVNHLLARALRRAGLAPEMWLYQIYSTVPPNVAIDITNEMDSKRSLMAMWKSVEGNRNWPHYIAGLNAAACRYVPGREERYAEPFFVMPCQEYLALCDRYFSHSPKELYRRSSYHGKAINDCGAD